LTIEEGLGFLPFAETTVITPTGSEFKGTRFVSKLCGVSIVRAGESMENALRVIPSQRLTSGCLQRHSNRKNFDSKRRKNCKTNG
jgi:uracil phosphoribosyltransferase